MPPLRLSTSLMPTIPSSETFNLPAHAYLETKATQRRIISALCKTLGRKK